MSKFYLVVLGAAITLVVVGYIVLSMRGSASDLEEEIAEASAKFKAEQYFRAEPAKKLVPQLKIGMTAKEVGALLGEPNRKRHNGSLWAYALDYSQFIDIRFDADGRVEEVVACAPGLVPESSDPNKPSGAYRLRKDGGQ